MPFKAFIVMLYRQGVALTEIRSLAPPRHCLSSLNGAFFAVNAHPCSAPIRFSRGPLVCFALSVYHDLSVLYNTSCGVTQPTWIFTEGSFDLEIRSNLAPLLIALLFLAAHYPRCSTDTRRLHIHPAPLNPTLHITVPLSPLLHDGLPVLSRRRGQL